MPTSCFITEKVRTERLVNIEFLKRSSVARNCSSSKNFPNQGGKWNFSARCYKIAETRPTLLLIFIDHELTVWYRLHMDIDNGGILLHCYKTYFNNVCPDIEEPNQKRNFSIIPRNSGKCLK